MRGVTLFVVLSSGSAVFQLTRLMRGVTEAKDRYINAISISTHTPHARRDSGSLTFEKRLKLFQLTRLMRGVT